MDIRSTWAGILCLAAMHATTLAGCAPSTVGAPDRIAEADGPSPRRVDALFDGERRTLDVSALVAMVPLEEDESVRVVLVGVDDHSSHHVVALRDAEPLHRHDRHDLLAIILRGHGRMWMDGEERAIGPDSITFIPRATVHSMRNDDDRPIVGYVVYWPPFDGRDRVLIEASPAP